MRSLSRAVGVYAVRVRVFGSGLCLDFFIQDSVK